MAWNRSLVFTFCVLMTSALVLAKQYRKDYEYDNETDAFYKLHVHEETSFTADSHCTMEGATLMTCTGTEDIKQVENMLRNFADIGDYLWISNDGKKHDIAEDDPFVIDLSPTEIQDGNDYDCFSPTCEVMTRSGEKQLTACCNKHPFVCKVDAKDVPYDPQCQVYGYQYEYYSSVGSCYKIPQMALTWNEAYAQCRADGAHLVILNSAEEHQAVLDLIQAVIPVNWSSFSAGVRATSNDGSTRFKTIFDKSLNEAGYNSWTGEYTNYEENNNCGAINRQDGKYKAVDCRDLNGFVCEKEVQYLSIPMRMGLWHR